jgi:glycosyltransferase involved in cell wall biosynthesis
LVLPSILEGQPIILLEAMATGKPVVASDIEGINETVLHRKTGLLVAPKDPSVLAEAIIGLLRDKDNRDQMGKTARKITEERFDIKEKIKQHETLYESILAKKSGAV